MFQVTPEGDAVWEYINPYFHYEAENILVSRVFRATHRQVDELPELS